MSPNRIEIPIVILRRFLSQCGGSMTIPALVFFTILMGVGGLAIDLQRLYGVHGQMQSYVDGAALAGATELDGQGDALTRSFRASWGDANHGPLVTGTQNFATGAAALSLKKVTFFSILGKDNSQIDPTSGTGDTVLCTYDSGTWAPMNCNTDAATAKAAKYVEVVAAPKTVSYVVLPVADVIGELFGVAPLTSSATLGLRATAGFKRAVCNNVPLMVCNPAEVTQGAGASFNAADWNGKQIAAKIQGSNAGWTPGNFGLTDNFPGNGADKMEEAMANINPLSACTEDTIVARNGEATNKVQNGMNVRFDIYVQDMKNTNTDPNYAPAPNVVKGEQPNGNACKTKMSGTSMPFPRDNCFMAAPTPGAGTGCTNYPAVGGTPRYGDGNWARAQYWNTNHPGIAWPPAGLSNASSRYDVYRYEIEHPQQVSLPGDEQGGPACSTAAPNLSRDRDRRVLYVAVVNCIEHAADITKGNVPVKAYAKVFITEPVGNTDWTNVSRAGLTWPTISNEDFMVEVFDVVKPNDTSGHLHVYPVLYR
jgi:hypothetical protein